MVSGGIPQLDVTKLCAGLPGVTTAQGATCAEACLVSFSDQDHQPGVEMVIEGIAESRYAVWWDGVITEQIERAWQDKEEATEHAACGIAFLLALEMTDYTVIERARKGTGFDYWLGRQENPYPFREARLEVSGIRTAQSENVIRRRVQQKIKQTNPSDLTSLPAYIVVVEFSRPLSHVAKK